MKSQDEIRQALDKLEWFSSQREFHDGLGHEAKMGVWAAVATLNWLLEKSRPDDSECPIQASIDKTDWLMARKEKETGDG